jgi:hypothetical protein
MKALVFDRLTMPPERLYVLFFATRLEDSAKPRIKPTAGLTQPVCDELAASNGQTAPLNDGGMVSANEVAENFPPGFSRDLRARKIDKASFGIG